MKNTNGELWQRKLPVGGGPTGEGEEEEEEEEDNNLYIIVV